MSLFELCLGGGNFTQPGVDSLIVLHLAPCLLVNFEIEAAAILSVELVPERGRELLQRSIVEL